MAANAPPSALPARRRGLRAVQTCVEGGPEGELERGEHVLCRGQGGGPHVGTVVGQRTAASGERYLLCRWYYRPEESEAGRQPFDSSSELLESDHVDVVPRSAVLSRCRVLPADEFAREREVQIAAIRAARETELFEQHPATGASRAAAEPWGKTFGSAPTPEEVELLNVMQRLLRLVQSEVRPDECRRPLQNWLGPPNAAMDKEEFPAQAGSKTAKSRASTLCPRVGTGGNISMLREVFYKPGGPNSASGDVLCPRLLTPEGSYGLVLDEQALRAEKGFNYALGLICPRTAKDEKRVRQARSVLQNLYFCRRKFEIATMQRTSSTEQRGMSATTNEWAHLNWIEAVQPRHCAVTGQPENLDFPLRMCPLRNVLVDPRYMHGARVVGPRKISGSPAGEKPARGSTARGGKASTGRGRGGRGGGGRHKSIPPQHWQPHQQASPQAATHMQPWNSDQAMVGGAGVAFRPQGQPARARSRGDGRAPRTQQIGSRGRGGRVRGTGRRAIGGPRGKGSRATHSQAFKWNGAAAGAAAAGAAAAGAPEASSSEDTDDLSDDSDDASDSSDDSSSSSSDSGAGPGKNRNGRKRAATSDEDDQASAPLPEPTDFELLEECQLARVDCLVSPLYRKRKLMNNTEAKELLGMCISECKRQAIDTAKQTALFAGWSNSSAVHQGDGVRGRSILMQKFLR